MTELRKESENTLHDQACLALTGGPESGLAHASATDVMRNDLYGYIPTSTRMTVSKLTSELP